MLIIFKETIQIQLWMGIIFCFLSWPAIASEPQEIAQQSKQITVKITGSGILQSGVLMGQDENNYWILTCTPKQKSAINKAKIITSDNQSYNPVTNKIIQLDKFPITLIPITVARSYDTANIGDSNAIKQGERVYVAGFIQPSSNQEQIPQFLFTDGIISSLVEQPNKSGFTYTNQIYPGMEGNPIFNEQGAMIGIYCQNYPLANQQKKYLQLNWGIPINPLTEFAQQQGLSFSGFSAFGSPPPSSEP